MKISNFIICDDIRVELGNKHSLMGIYSNSINFQSSPDQKDAWPKTKRLCVFAQIEVEKEKIADFHSFQIEIDYNGKKDKIGGSNLPTPNPKTQQGIMLQAIFSNFKFKAPGEIIFTFKFYDKAEKKLFEITSPQPFKVEETIIKSQ
jgi:hypothetical protein